MEIIPDLKDGVIYPKDCPLHCQTLYNIKVRRFNDNLVLKVPNEFKHLLKNYNHRNVNRFSWYIDGNNYSHF